MHLDFRKWLRAFLLNGSFGDIEFYYFSVDQSWINGIKWVLVNVSVSHSVVSDSLRPHGLYSLPDSSVHGDSLGKNIGVGYHALLQGIFPTQGLNLSPLLGEHGVLTTGPPRESHGHFGLKSDSESLAFFSCSTVLMVHSGPFALLRWGLG